MLILLVGAAWLQAWPAWFVDGPQAVSAASAPAVGVEITRADLAAAYLRFEKAWQAHTPSKALRERANREFDQATLAFFSGSYGSAIATINRVAASLRPRSTRTAATEIAESLKIRFMPRVVVAGSAMPVSVRVDSLYEIEFEQPRKIDLEIRLLNAAGPVVRRMPLEVAANAATRISESLSLLIGAKDLPVGAYTVQVGATTGGAVTAARFFVVPQALADVRAANTKRLSRIRAETPELQQALATCFARSALLMDEASDTQSAQFLADPVQLAVEVNQEIEQLSAGQDPYQRRVGDYWRVLRLGMMDVPLRVFAPRAAATGTALPLLIVLHGAGGDENMFMDGYGAGRIKELAEARGLIVASPLTYSFGASPRSVDRLLQSLSYNYTIDRSRVYVLGHSMGAGVAAGLSRTKSDVLAAVCCMAGAGRFTGKQNIAPTLMIAGALDPLTRGAEFAERSVKVAKEAGKPVELKVLPDYGHTLMVGDELPAAVDWLLRHQLHPPASLPADR